MAAPRQALSSFSDGSNCKTGHVRPGPSCRNPRGVRAGFSIPNRRALIHLTPITLEPIGDFAPHLRAVRAVTAGDDPVIVAGRQVIAIDDPAGALQIAHRTGAAKAGEDVPGEIDTSRLGRDAAKVLDGPALGRGRAGRESETERNGGSAQGKNKPPLCLRSSG